MAFLHLKNSSSNENNQVEIADNRNIRSDPWGARGVGPNLGPWEVRGGRAKLGSLKFGLKAGMLQQNLTKPLVLQLSPRNHNQAKPLVVS